MQFRTAVTIYFLVFTMVLAAMLFLIPKVHAYNYGGSYEDTLEQPMKPVGYQYGVKPAAPVKIERYAPPDWKNDPTVLVALPKERPAPVVEVNEKVVVKYVVEKPEPEPIVTYSYSQD